MLAILKAIMVIPHVVDFDRLSKSLTQITSINLSAMMNRGFRPSVIRIVL